MLLSQILKVPQDLLLPHIAGEDLRASALMDQTTRKPFTTRNLNHMGKFAYELAIAVHLAATYPGNPNLKELQCVLSSEDLILHLSRKYNLDKIMTFQRAATTEYNPQLEVFYAWMGAAFIEQGIEPIRLFVMSLVEANRDEILSAGAKLAGLAKERSGVTCLQSQENDMNDGIDVGDFKVLNLF
ncbi:hypothetical protein ABW20_dc0100578 [Dactylellina cionopaga]|nr:hypothetical protein ABW20_dc0100578 [Dactylellina cionopaga]